jgi:hypothetical protein
MDTAHHLEAWRDLYVMLGTSAAALIGQLFVASSLHLGDMAGNQALRLRSRNVTLHLVAMLVQAMAILTPQPLMPLGVEVAIVNLCGIVMPLSLAGRVFRKDSAVSLYRWLSYMTGYALGVAGGVALACGLVAGLYAVTLSNALFFVAVVLDAWKMLLGLREARGAPDKTGARA